MSEGQPWVFLHEDGHLSESAGWRTTTARWRALAWQKPGTPSGEPSGFSSIWLRFFGIFSVDFKGNLSLLEICLFRRLKHIEVLGFHKPLKTKPLAGEQKATEVSRKLVP